jgi:hypothetical protein
MGEQMIKILKWFKMLLLQAFDLLWKKEKICVRLTQAELEPPTRTVMYDNPTGLFIGYHEWESRDKEGNLILTMTSFIGSDKWEEFQKECESHPITREMLGKVI